MPAQTKIVIYLYNRLFDPLIQGNFWLYVLDYLNDPAAPVSFHVVTHEDPRHPLTDEQVTARLQSEGIDVTRRWCAVELTDVAVTADDVVHASDAHLGELVAVLGAAESVGAMQADFDVALQYAKDRIAFGRPIGSFQAIKHVLADTSLALEMSKAITLAAAETLGSGDDHGVQIAAMAKAFVNDSGQELAQNCFQIFGGIGFTWEHDQHLYLRRLATDAVLYGAPDWQRERLCQLAGL